MYFENLVALHIAIEKQCTPEIAFKYLDRFEKNIIEGKPNFKWSIADFKDINALMQQGLNCGEIAEIYFTSKNVINGVLRKYKKRAAATAQFKNFAKHSSTV